jgi:hypothetical protein
MPQCVTVEPELYDVGAAAARCLLHSPDPALRVDPAEVEGASS